MNNEDVKKYLSKSFDIVEEKNILTYIYTCALIRVRNDLIKNESLSIFILVLLLESEMT